MPGFKVAHLHVLTPALAHLLQGLTPKAALDDNSPQKADSLRPMRFSTNCAHCTGILLLKTVGSYRSQCKLKEQEMDCIWIYTV